jgi:hypothetical protein
MFLQRTGENSFLVRTHHNDPQLALLFELCVVFKKKTKAQAAEQETGELCCGWCRLPLFQPTQGTTPAVSGAPGTPGNEKLLEFRTFELGLQGGTPFDEYHEFLFIIYWYSFFFFFFEKSKQRTNRPK